MTSERAAVFGAEYGCVGGTDRGKTDIEPMSSQEPT